MHSMYQKFVDMWMSGFHYGLAHGAVLGACGGALLMAVAIYLWEKR